MHKRYCPHRDTLSCDNKGYLSNRMFSIDMMGLVLSNKLARTSASFVVGGSKSNLTL